MSIPEGGTILKQFDVTGMSCAACSARVEKAVSHVPGVTACAVSLLTNSMGVVTFSRIKGSTRMLLCATSKRHSLF